MGVKERRDTEIENMKNNIMRAAIEIINKEGYEKLSIRKIAAKIEYSPAAIYLYYKDKAQIITDMANLLYDKIMEEVHEIMQSTASHSSDKTLRELILVFIQVFSNEPEMTKAILHSSTNVIFAGNSIEGIPNNPGIALLNQLIDAGIIEKKFKAHTSNTAWMILSALLGFMMSVIESQLYQLESFDNIVAKFIDLLMGGILIW